MHFFPKAEHWGISICTEMLLSDHTEWVICVPLVYKVNNDFWLRTGFGWELYRNETYDINSYILYRIGGGYDFHLGKISLSPSLDIDVLRSHAAMVAGLNIGFGF